MAKASCVGYLGKYSAFNGANCPALILEKTDYFQIMGILNSSLITYYLRSICPPKLQNYCRFNANNLNSIPIPQERPDLFLKIGALAKELTELTINDELGNEQSRGGHAIINIGIQIKDEIDKLVFDLYAVSSSERQNIMNEMGSFKCR